MNKAQPWKKVSSKNILDNRQMCVLEDTVQLPNGKSKKYVHIASQTDSVVVIALNRHGQILLQREYSYPPNEVMWQLPGGSLEPDEDAESAALRELSEESGYSANFIKLIGHFYTSNRTTDKKQHIALCKGIIKRKFPENDDEFIDSHWVDVKTLHEMIRNRDITNINLLAALNVWLHHESMI